MGIDSIIRGIRVDITGWDIGIVAGSQQGQHEKRLLNNLLGPYNVLERPVANESEPLEVKFGLTLQQIIDVVSITFSVRILINLRVG